MLSEDRNVQFVPGYVKGDGAPGDWLWGNIQDHGDQSREHGNPHITDRQVDARMRARARDCI